MRRKIAEEWVLFISILKWTVYASVIGVVVGFSTSLFLKALDGSMKWTAKYPYYFLLLPLVFLLSAWFVKTFAPDAEGHGTEKVIEAVHRRAGRIKPAVVPVKLIATVITIAFGGSAGKEGPCAQIGAGISSTIADIFRFDDSERKKLVICGISAGFAAVFGTPIAGALFGVEVLFIGGILYDVLLPSFIAGITSYHIAASLGVEYFYHPIKFMPQFSEFFFLKVCLSGIFFGVCAIYLIEILKFAEKMALRLNVGKLRQALTGGSVLALLGLIYSGQYLGLGLETIEGCLQGAAAPWEAFFLKGIFTSITLGFGGSGGIVTPIFFIGSTAGSLFAGVMGLNVATFSAIGMVSLLAGAANTPIAASIMAVELFGNEVAPYATVACIISFLITGHRSVYPSQILSVKKSASLGLRMGEEINQARPEIVYRRSSWAFFMKKTADWVFGFRTARKSRKKDSEENKL